MGGLTWALSGGLFSPLSSPARPLTSSLLQPLAPAPAPLCCYLWGLDGRRGAAAPAPPPAQTGWEGGEGRGRDTAWEGATEPGRRAGWGQAQGRTPCRHSDTHLLPITPTLSIIETHAHCSGIQHTHIPPTLHTSGMYTSYIGSVSIYAAPRSGRQTLGKVSWVWRGG